MKSTYSVIKMGNTKVCRKSYVVEEFKGFRLDQKMISNHSNQSSIFLKLKKTVHHINWDAHTAKFTRTGSNIVMIAYWKKFTNILQILWSTIELSGRNSNFVPTYAMLPGIFEYLMCLGFIKKNFTLPQENSAIFLKTQ